MLEEHCPDCGKIYEIGFNSCTTDPECRTMKIIYSEETIQEALRKVGKDYNDLIQKLFED